MKLFTFSILLLVSCSESLNTSFSKNVNKDSAFTQYLFNKDSGYIEKKEFSHLTKYFPANSISTSFKELPDTDTIGKYFTNLSTGKLVACIIDPAEEFYGHSHILIELKHNTNRDSIIEIERFSHNNRPCCWKNYDSGFKKLGNYFYFRLCGTGSGYCSGKMYLFKTVLPQNKLNAIAEIIHSQYLGQSQDLISDMELSGSNVRMNYTLESNLYKDPTKKPVKIIKKFKVNYTLQQNQWVADDSTNLRDLDY